MRNATCARVFSRKSHQTLLLQMAATILAIAAMVGLGACGGGGGAGPSAPPLPPKPSPAAAGNLAASPVSLAFGTVTIGQTATQQVTLTNQGAVQITIQSAVVSGAGLSVTGLITPLGIGALQTASFEIQFTPQSAGGVTGSLVLTSDASDTTLTIPLTATGGQGQLGSNPASLAFGNVPVGTQSVLGISIQNTGTTAVNVTQITLPPSAFTLATISTPFSLAAGQSLALSATFAPLATGNLASTLTIASDATGSPLAISLSGTGTSQPGAHSADLAWTGSTQSVAGYNVYRGSQSGGPYSKINTLLVSGTAYTDSTVVAGQTYFYVVSAVDAKGNESPFSNGSEAMIPTP